MGRHQRAPVLLVVCASLFATAPRCDWVPPRVDPPRIGAFLDRPVEIRGSGFEERGPDQRLLVGSPEGRYEVPSLSFRILEWSNERIVAKLPPGQGPGWIQVATFRGASKRVPMDVFEYEWFDVPETSGTGSPLALAVDPGHRVWVNQEFHQSLHVLDPTDGLVESLPIPQPPGPGPFAQHVYGESRTQMSILGEDILVTPEHQIWFTQGGAYLYAGSLPNHSRIVCFDPEAPASEAFRVYNVPGDGNEVIGLAWDALRHRMWFAEGGLLSGGKLVSFDPDRIPPDNHFDFSESLEDQVCPPEGPYENCFRVYPLPNPMAQPAHLVVDDGGYVWLTEYWADAVARLDPESGTLEEIPLPAPIGAAEPARYVGSGPWRILLSRDGDVVFNEYFDSTLVRLPADRIGDPDCRSLDEAGRNPCLEELVVPDVDLVDEQVHSIAFDDTGNLWFTLVSAAEADNRASLGFVSPDWRHVVRLPPLPSEMLPPGKASGAGLAIDPETGDIWFAEFYRDRIGHLRRVPE